MKLDLHEYEDQNLISFGTLKTFTIQMDPLPTRTRTIRVWLPPCYDGVRRFPVMYLHDGNALFTNRSGIRQWELEKSMSKLPDSEQIILVAIDTSHPERAEELCPPLELGKRMRNFGNFTPRGDLYRDFVVKTLKPLIDENFMTLPDREHTGVGGASMGGLESYYMHLSCPEVFGRSLCLSIGYGATDDADWYLRLFDAVKDQVINDRIVIYNGGQTADVDMTESSISIYRHLEKAGMDYHHVCMWVDSRQAHYSVPWGNVFTEGVHYLFAEDNSVEMPAPPPANFRRPRPQ